MEDLSLLELCVDEDVVQSLCSLSKSTTLEKSLEKLIEVSRTDSGRSELTSELIITMVIQLLQSLPYPSARQFLVLSLRLTRNLCAGEALNQTTFVEQHGVGAVLSVFRSARACPDVDCGIIRLGLQVIANVSLAGEMHRRAIWGCLFPQEILALAKIRSREVSDPLCMLVFACSDGYPGSPIVREIVKTTASVGFGEDWLKLLLSRICLEQPHFPPLFSELSRGIGDVLFSSEQAFLLRMVSEILNERLEDREFIISTDFSQEVLEIFKSSVVAVIDHGTGTRSGLPTGSAETDVLGYSLTILRDICARESSIVDTLISSGLVELLLTLLGDLGPPTKVKPQSQDSKPCPYKGFRRDVVAVIGNCVYRRKYVQDDIRGRDAILVMLQQCVSDEDNPFLREWGIWAVRNLLEGNAENQQAVAELEIRGTIDTPELAGLGLKVEVDQNSGRPKLVNIPGMKQQSSDKSDFLSGI